MSLASNLLDKTADQLTVRDQFKLTAIFFTAFVGVPMVIAGVGAAAQEISARRHAKKLEIQNTL